MGSMAGTFRQFEVFVAVCEEKSVSGAARRLEVSQAAVSRQVAALERRIGAKLFDRSPGKVSSLSVHGEVLLEQAIRMLRLGQTMRSCVQAGPTIRVGADQMIANLAIKALFDDGRAHPPLHGIQLIETDSRLDPAAELEASALDLLYFTAGPGDKIPTGAKLAARSESGLFISPDLWAGLISGCSLPLIFPAGVPRVADGIRAVLEERLEGRYHVAAEVEPISALELLLTGLGAGIMNRKRASRLLDVGLLIEVPTFRGPVEVSRYELRRDRASNRVEEVSSVLLNAVRMTFVPDTQV